MPNYLCINPKHAPHIDLYKADRSGVLANPSIAGSEAKIGAAEGLWWGVEKAQNSQQIAFYFTCNAVSVCRVFLAPCYTFTILVHNFQGHLLMRQQVARPV